MSMEDGSCVSLVWDTTAGAVAVMRRMVTAWNSAPVNSLAVSHSFLMYCGAYFCLTGSGGDVSFWASVPMSVGTFSGLIFAVMYVVV